MASRREISKWYDEGVEKGSAYMCIACDTFDYTYYPVYSSSIDEAKRFSRSPGEMQRVKEVYNLKSDKQGQMNARRAWAIT